MTPTAQLLTTMLAWGTLLLQLGVVIIIAALSVEWRGGIRLGLLEQVRKWALFLMLVIASVGSTLTLVYSEVFGFLPCGLCWLQRVFLYPQVVILAIAAWKGERSIADYILGLSIPGFLIALYQHFIQVGGTDFLPCPATPGGADCAQRIIFEFGYITFPMMAATAFAALIVLALASKKGVQRDMSEFAE